MKIVTVITAFLFLSACSSNTTPPQNNEPSLSSEETDNSQPAPPSESLDPAITPPDSHTVQSRENIFRLNEQLGRGINVSGLEQPLEGDWNFELRNDSFSTIALGGFDSVRLPIKWDSRAARLENGINTAEGLIYPIESAFFERVDGVIVEALDAGLRVIITMHLYEDIMKNLLTERSRFLNLWDQVARHYADFPDTLYFEILNEPSGQFNQDPELWNELLEQALQTIRNSNPDRAVIVGPVNWNLIENLQALQLPPDHNLIVSVHYYERGQFTHQGAQWVEPPFPVGVEWYAQTQRLGPALQNWSWDTGVEYFQGFTSASFKRSGAAVNIYTPSLKKPVSFSVDVRGQADIAVICRSGIDFIDTGAEIIQDTNAWRSYNVSLERCPDNTNQVALQNLAHGPANIDLRRGDLCDDSNCTPFLLSEQDAMDLAFDIAAKWGTTNNRPMNLGEFGAYEEADIASRGRWTAAVQLAAQRREFSSHYWEFEQGFGAWNRYSGEWLWPLYKALLPSKEQ